VAALGLVVAVLQGPNVVQPCPMESPALTIWVDRGLVVAVDQHRDMVLDRGLLAAVLQARDVVPP